MAESTLNIDIDTAVKNVLGGRPSPGHEKVAEEIVKNLRTVGVPLNPVDEAYIGIKVLQYHRDVLRAEEPKKPDPEPSDSDRLYAVLMARYGTNWSGKTVKVEVRVDALTWIIRLAEWGLDQRRKEWRETKPAERDVGLMMSLGSWAGDIQTLVDAAIAEVEKSKGKPVTRDAGADERDLRMLCFTRYGCAKEFWHPNYGTMSLTSLIKELQERKENVLNSSAKPRLELVIRDLNKMMK